MCRGADAEHNHVRGQTLAIHIARMKKIIRANGHLVLEGDESTEDLRQALIYLCGHFPIECQRPELGTPIGELIPDITWLAPRKVPPKRRSVKTAAISTDKL
jgi:hypothetical protein